MAEDFRDLLDDLMIRAPALAERSGVTRAFVHHVIVGIRSPSPETIAAWAKALRVSKRRVEAAVRESRRRARKGRG